MHGRMAMAASEPLHAISPHHVRDEYLHLMRAVLRPQSVLQRELARVLTPPARSLSLSLSLRGARRCCMIYTVHVCTRP
jgi:hypothetical protein